MPHGDSESSKPPPNHCLSSMDSVNLKGPASDTVRYLSPVDTEHFTEHYKIIIHGWRRHSAEARIVRNVRDAKAAATKFKWENSSSGRHSWIPPDLAAGGS
jgi:hypothetical protein